MHETGGVERSLVDRFSQSLMSERAKLRVNNWNELVQRLLSASGQMRRRLPDVLVLQAASRQATLSVRTGDTRQEFSPNPVEPARAASC
jgi:hypothetical protein